MAKESLDDLMAGLQAALNRKRTPEEWKALTEQSQAKLQATERSLAMLAQVQTEETDHTMDYTPADEVIAGLLARGLDYSSKREEIALLFDEHLYNGNWDATTDFDDLPNLRFIQEDEFDQHMDDGPSFDSQLAFLSGHYIFPA